MRPPVERLSQTQFEILGLLAGGLLPKEIAVRRHVTLPTIRWHLKQVRQRGGWKTNEQACAWYGYQAAEKLALVQLVDRFSKHLREGGR